MFMPLFRAVIERNVLRFLVQLKVRGRGKTLGEGGLTVELVGQLVGIEHGLGVNARGLGQSRIKDQGGRSRQMSRLVGEHKKSLLAIRFVGVEWDIARPRRRSFERRNLAGLAGGCFGGSQQANCRLNRNGTGA
jgi:hypothetical protein